MSAGDGSVGAAVFALLALGLLASAAASPWLTYDHSSGRKTAPDGAYGMEGDGVERSHLTFSLQGWDGDASPSDPARAERALGIATGGMIFAAALLLLVAAAELPGVRRFVGRRASLAATGVALAALAAVAAATWVWLPGSLAGLGVEGPFTARLDEPAGYTHTALGWGWYATSLAMVGVVAAFLFKLQAGLVDVSVIEAEAAREAQT